VLAGHLQQIVQRCRAAGAKVVLLGYPLVVDDLEAVQQEVAAAAGVPLVRCMPAFAEQLQRRPREELYIRDGHCTDAGYALLAETAMATLLDALRR